MTMVDGPESASQVAAIPAARETSLAEYFTHSSKLGGLHKPLKEAVIGKRIAIAQSNVAASSDSTTPCCRLPQEWFARERWTK
jgi:hypothetical protein